LNPIMKRLIGSKGFFLHYQEPNFQLESTNLET